MKPKEAPLAGYLLARAAMHRKIEDKHIVRSDGTIKESPVLKNLRAGHASVKEASERMPLGRANVIEDIFERGNAHLPLRKLAAQKMFRSMVLEEGASGRMLGEADYFRLGAAVSQFAKTGVCSTFAMSTNPLHAAKLAEMKDTRAIVAQTHSAEFDHSWSEMMPKGKRADGTLILSGKDVVMDGWCKENLAILREDSGFARLDKDGKPDQFIHRDLLNHETGPEALRKVDQYKAQIGRSPDLRHKFRMELNRLAHAEESSWMGNVWNDTSVFDDGFREQAGMALHKHAGKPSPIPNADPVSVRAKHVSMAEIQAIGVARSLGSNIRGAKAEAPEIIASAKAMFPAPD